MGVAAAVLWTLSCGAAVEVASSGCRVWFVVDVVVTVLPPLAHPELIPINKSRSNRAQIRCVRFFMIDLLATVFTSIILKK